VNVRIRLTAIMAACIWVPTIAANDDPWRMVPALPTACYDSEDHWLERIDAAADELNQALYQQQSINEEINQQATDSFSEDPMALAQRMQQALMADPQNAQKMIEMTQQGEQLQTEIPAQHEREVQFEAESKTIVEQYQAALARAMEPANSRWRELDQRLSLGNMPDPSWPDLAWATWFEVQHERNQAYAETCGTWWAATGPIHAYLERYRTYLVVDRIPHEQGAFDNPKLEHYRALNVATDGWRTETDYKAAQDYVRRARELFNNRESVERCASMSCI